MARSKAQMTHAKRDRERARLEKRARKRDKKEARKLTTSGAAALADATSDDDAVGDAGTPANREATVSSQAAGAGLSHTVTSEDQAEM
jgi:hypothetical protein